MYNSHKFYWPHPIKHFNDFIFIRNKCVWKAFHFKLQVESFDFSIHSTTLLVAQSRSKIFGYWQLTSTFQQIRDEIEFEWISISINRLFWGNSLNLSVSLDTYFSVLLWFVFRGDWNKEYWCLRKLVCCLVGSLWYQ